MHASIHKSINNPTESQQTLVDQASLSSTFVLCPRSLDILAACQIHEIELAGTNIIFSIIALSLDISSDSENCMTSTTEIVAFGCGNLTLVTTGLQEFHTFDGALDM